jgi:hypothetical protein
MDLNLLVPKSCAREFKLSIGEVYNASITCQN